MLYKDCVIVSNEGHSQYFEWPSLARITQPFYSVNSLSALMLLFNFENTHAYVFPLNFPLYCVLSHWRRRRRRQRQSQSSNNIIPVTSTCFPTVERPRFPN